jgi:hypothetical protein
MPTHSALSSLQATIASRVQSGASVNDLFDSLDYRELSSLVESPRLVRNALDLYLARPNKYSLLARGLAEGAIRSAKGRLIATNLLHRAGRSLPNAATVYAHLLDDRSWPVVDGALFAMSLLQTPECEQAILQRIPGASPARRGHLERALAAMGVAPILNGLPG